MKILLVFLCGLLALPGFGKGIQQRKPGSEEYQTPHVLQMDEDFPIESLDGNGIVVHPLSEVNKHSEALPAPIEDQFFLESGLAQFVKGWDGFEKDRLALRAEHQDPREVFGRYEGRLPEEAIRKLKRSIQEYRRSQE